MGGGPQFYTFLINCNIKLLFTRSIWSTACGILKYRIDIGSCSVAMESESAKEYVTTDLPKIMEVKGSIAYPG